MINRSYLAVLYYNLIYENKYDITKTNDLKKAYSAFSKPIKVNKEILLQAIALYNELLSKEFETLVTKKCNGNI